MAQIHENSDTYYLDQLCLIALSAAFGGVCLTLYFLNTNMLKVMLASQFHEFIFCSGAVLLLLAMIRAAALWREVGQSAAQPANDDGHSFCADHAHGHVHKHGHEHGWSPWRYLLLLLPVFLFLLGLPNKPPRARAMSVHAAVALDTVLGYSGFIAESAAPLQAFGVLVAFEQAGRPQNIKHPAFMRLVEAPSKNPDLEGTWVTVKGLYMPGPARNDHAFNLARIRRICCAGDAQQINLAVNSRQSLRDLNFKENDWVLVTGKVEFRGRRTVLQVTNVKYIAPTDPDPDYYVN